MHPVHDRSAAAADQHPLGRPEVTVPALDQTVADIPDLPDLPGILDTSDTAGIVAAVTAAAGPVFDQIEWAEDEITRAGARHPQQLDLLYHCFSLLTPTSELMATEFVYRGHCRELLDRMAAGGDPREPTRAEVAVTCSQVSLAVPPDAAFVTVYMRAWTAAFPDTQAFESLDLASYERVAGDRADGLEADVRRRLRRADRQLPVIDCGGLHHGAPRPDCVFVTAARAGDDPPVRTVEGAG